MFARAEPADGALDLVVNRADKGRALWLQQFEAGAVALAGIDWQVHAHRAQQWCRERAAGCHHRIGQQTQCFVVIQAASPRISCPDSYGFNSVARYFQTLNGVAVQKPGTPAGAAFGQRLGKHAGVAAFVAGGVGASHNSVRK